MPPAPRRRRCSHDGAPTHRRGSGPRLCARADGRGRTPRAGHQERRGCEAGAPADARAGQSAGRGTMTIRETLTQLLEDAETARSELNTASCEVNRLRARIVLALAAIDGTEDSRDAR